MDIEARKKIGAALQKCRKKAGFRSAALFAEHMGFNPSTYTDWEQGRHLFTYEQAWRMADALGCSLDELGGREWPPGGSGALSGDERGLVESYRLMDQVERETLRSVAGSFVLASEKDGSGDPQPLAIPEHPVARRE